jgi:hypothetical protein
MLTLISRIGIKVSNKKYLYFFLNFTWDLLLTLLGYFLMLILLPFGKVRKYSYTLYFEFNKKTGWGFSIGTVFFVGKYAGKSMKQHEFGHTVQNAILGPFMKTLYLGKVLEILQIDFFQSTPVL